MDLSQPPAFSTLRCRHLPSTRRDTSSRQATGRISLYATAASGMHPSFQRPSRCPMTRPRHHHADNDPCWYSYRLMHASLAFPKLERSSGCWNEVCIRFWLINIERTYEAGLACMSSAMVLDFRKSFPELDLILVRRAVAASFLSLLLLSRL
jgi:hypothetical protein